MSAFDFDRAVVRYSSGCPSAVVAKLAIASYGHDRTLVVKSDTRSENDDNERFDREVSEWLDHEITYVASEKYRDIWDVFERERFIVSSQGAKCRGVLKLEPFYEIYRPTDLLLFGYTADKKDAKRALNLQTGAAEMMGFPLIERGLTKRDCKAIIDRAGIEIPLAYRLGFSNNNCRGCPKGGMAYWNLVRVCYPADFERMCRIQDELGAGSWFLIRRGERISLRMLEPGDGRGEVEEDFDCSLACAIAEQDMSAALRQSGAKRGETA